MERRKKEWGEKDNRMGEKEERMEREGVENVVRIRREWREKEKRMETEGEENGERRRREWRERRRMKREKEWREGLDIGERMEEGIRNRRKNGERE